VIFKKGYPDHIEGLKNRFVYLFANRCLDSNIRSYNSVLIALLKYCTRPFTVTLLGQAWIFCCERFCDWLVKDINTTSLNKKKVFFELANKTFF